MSPTSSPRPNWRWRRTRTRRHIDGKAWFDHCQTMEDGPDIAITAALIGDPARANMVMALMSGHSLTMGDLAGEAGVTLSTANSHLAKLEFSGIVVSQKVGRSRYFHLANPDVAHCIE